MRSAELLISDHRGKDARCVGFSRQENGLLSLVTRLPAGPCQLEVVVTGGAETPGKGAPESDGGGVVSVQTHAPIPLAGSGGKLLLEVTDPGFHYFGLEMGGSGATPTVSIYPSKGRGLPASAAAQGGFRAEHLLEMTIPVAITLGRTRMTVSQLAALGAGSLLVLETRVGEALSLTSGERCLAVGEAVVLEGRFGLRINGMGTGTPDGNQPSRNVVLSSAGELP